MKDIVKIKELLNVFEKVLNECPEIIFIGDPILRQKTEDVSHEDAIKIGEKLKDVIKKYRTITGFGRGLAAPQIGINKSVFVTFTEDSFKLYINPKIIETSTNYNFFRETCLSCGYLSVDVKRPVSFCLEYMDENGKIVKDTFNGFTARLLQHEYDHLLGIMNVDIAEKGSVNFLLNDPLQEKLREIA